MWIGTLGPAVGVGGSNKKLLTLGVIQAVGITPFSTLVLLTSQKKVHLDHFWPICSTSEMPCGGGAGCSAGRYKNKCRAGPNSSKNRTNASTNLVPSTLVYLPTNSRVTYIVSDLRPRVSDVAVFMSSIGHFVEQCREPRTRWCLK